MGLKLSNRTCNSVKHSQKGPFGRIGFDLSHCDMRHFPTQNICLYGPGGGKNPHGIDEHYFLDQIPVVARNIFDLVLEWCNELK